MRHIARYYETLGLEPGATADEIKQAWRDLAQVWHPDRFSDNERLRKKAQEKLKEVNEAYQILRNPPVDGAAGPNSEPPSSPAHVHWAPSTEDPTAAVNQRELLTKDGVNAWNLWRKKYSDLRPDLKGADLRKADLVGADLRETDLSAALLHEADLYKANLSNSNLRQAKLSRADLNRAMLINADLSGADLESADFSSADLSGAHLRKANLHRAQLIGASLCGADLTGALGLTREQISEALTDAETRLPSFPKG